MAFRLQLLDFMKINLLFHVFFLESYKDSFSFGRSQPPPPMEIHGNKEYEVEEFFNSKFVRRNQFYFVHWQGYDINERTWEPSTNVNNVQDKV